MRSKPGARRVATNGCLSARDSCAGPRVKRAMRMPKSPRRELMTRANLSTPPPPVPSTPSEHTALDLSTGARTLGEMLLRSEGRVGVALNYKDGGAWRDISYH